jgi:hypothetical protein
LSKKMAKIWHLDTGMSASTYIIFSNKIWQ